jgi:hypothetical protein
VFCVDLLDADVDSSDLDGRSGLSNTHTSHGTTPAYGGAGMNEPGYGNTSGGVTGAAGAQYGQDGLVTESKRVHNNKILNKLDPGTKTDSNGNPI